MLLAQLGSTGGMPQGSKQLVVIAANTSWYVHNFRSTLIRRLLLEYRVLVAAGPDTYSIRLGELGCEYHPVTFHQDGAHPPRDLSTFAQFVRLYHAVRPAFVLNFTPKANAFSGLACAGRDTVAINNISGLGRAFSDQSLGWARLASVWLYRATARVVKHTFYQNRHDMAFGINQRFSSPERCSLLPGSGVDVARFKPSIRPQEDVLHFVHVARLLPAKGVFDFLAAAIRLQTLLRDSGESPRIRFTIAGPDSSLGPVEQREFAVLLKASGAEYLGMLDQVEDLMAQAHYVVLPSTYAEGVPRSLIEASACGKLLICYPNHGSEEIARHGVNALVTEEASVDALTDAMFRAARMSPDAYLSMCQNAVEIAHAEFDEQLVIQRYLERMHSLAPRPV